MSINEISSCQSLQSLPGENVHICTPEQKQKNLQVNNKNGISIQGAQAFKSLAFSNITFKSAALDNENNVESIKKALDGIIEEDKKRERPVFLEVDPKFTYKLAKLITDPKKRITMGITGQSAGGKSFFREKIMETPQAKSGKYAFINMDDYYKDVNDEVEKYDSQSEFIKATNFNFDIPEAVDLNHMKDQILDLKAGLFVCAPKHYYETSITIPNSRMVEPSKIIVVDGTFCQIRPEMYEEPRRSRVPDMAKLMDIKMYVDASPNEIKKRWYERAAKRGVTGDAADIQFKTVTQEAGRHIKPAKEYADVAINGEAKKEDYQEVFGKIFQLINDTKVK